MSGISSSRLLMKQIRARWVLVLLCLAALGAVLLPGQGCSGKKDQGGEEFELPKLPVSVPKVTFTDITKQAGIRFTHTNGAYGKKLLPETMGSGVAFLDYDNDGKQDLLFVNSCPWPGSKDRTEATLKLYRNRGDGTFEDVTEKAGLNVTMYGMGVTCGDYDNDGWIDVFITGVGGNRLFRNDRGRFVDVTDKMKVGGPGGWGKALAAGDFEKHGEPLLFSSSATFLDYDGDGRLDLFVCNYVIWSPQFDLSKGFTLAGDTRAYGAPRYFEGTTCILYRNMGDHFEDVSERAGVQVLDTEGVGPGTRKRGVGKSLGVIVCDPDEDGWPDIVVANDTVRNFFFHNVEGKNGERVFQEEGTVSGVAYAGGRERGAMGIDWGEYRPGLHALIIANFSNEPNTFLRLDNKKRRSFQDVASNEGIARASGPPLKFGAFFFDYDLDGRLDLLTCNGHLEPDIARVQEGQTFAQPAQLFWNTGLKAPQRSYEEVTAREAAGDLFRPMVGRGCAYADIDGDGYLDVVLTANGGPVRLLRNNGGEGKDRNNWARLVLRGDGKRSNTSAIGARVEIQVGDRILHREVIAARGYLSQSELPITVGLGKATRVDRVTIHWPGRNTSTQVVEDLAANKVHVIEQK
jgi:hypothetical protein